MRMDMFATLFWAGISGFLVGGATVWLIIVPNWTVMFTLSILLIVILAFWASWRALDSANRVLTTAGQLKAAKRSNEFLVQAAQRRLERVESK